MLTSPLLAAAGFGHAFFTRLGGVSHGPYASLNFSWSTGDDEACVRQNLERAATALGVPVSRLYFLSQIHGAVVQQVDGDEPWDRVIRTEGDALLSAQPGLACAVRVADCVPILIADARSGAVCAVHAGWRGAVAGIAAAAVDALRARPGAGELLAAVGPHISAASFEIGDEVAAQIEAAAPGHGVIVRSPGQKPHADLRRLVTWQLHRAGVEQVDQVMGCTVLDPARFFSFRRDGARSGRHLAAIVPRGPR